MSTDFAHYQHPPQHSPQSQTLPYKVPPVTVILTIVLLVFFFAVIFSICLCRYFTGYLFNSSVSRRIPPRRNAARPTTPVLNGLDSSIIDTFPTLVYSLVKDLQQENCGLECAVCLLEFEDNDELRLITVCNHVFHKECIDIWFGDHTTCPLCRSSLIPQEISSQTNIAASPEDNQQERDTRANNNSEPRENELEVVVEGGDSHEGATSGENGTQDEGQQGEERVVERFSRYYSMGHSVINVAPEVNIDQDRHTLRLPDDMKENIIRGHQQRQKVAVDRFSSHSTGHSVIHVEPEMNIDDRHTLRLPDHVREHIIRGHHGSGSCTTFEEFFNDAGQKSGFAEHSGSPTAM